MSLCPNCGNFSDLVDEPECTTCGTILIHKKTKAPPKKSQPISDETSPNLMQQLDDPATVNSIAVALDEGKHSSDIVSALVRNGAPKQEAKSIVAEVKNNLGSFRENPQWRFTQRSRGIRRMTVGGLILLAGIVGTIVSYFALSSDGGYLVASGAIISGLIGFFSGLFQTIKYSGR